MLVLGNHGLVVAADTVAEAEALLGRVSRPARPPGATGAAAGPRRAGGAGGGARYRLPAAPEAHGAATDSASCRHAAGGSLYPDHVIFLGPGSAVARDGETADDVAARRRRMRRSRSSSPAAAC